MKRSICASGSGYVPSDSIGFCVAITRNGSGTGMRRVADRHLALLHHLEQRRLHLRRRAVDLVREQEVAEDGAELGVERALAGPVDARADEVGRHEVGRELHARERAAEHAGRRLDRQRLREARERPRSAGGPARAGRRARARASRPARRSRAGSRTAPARGAPWHRGGDGGNGHERSSFVAGPLNVSRSS